MKRRVFLAAGGSLAAGMFSPVLRFPAQAGGGRMALSTVHEEAAAAARRIVGDSGPATSLNILLPAGSSANVRPVAEKFAEATGIRIAYTETPVDEINSQMIIDTVSGAGSFDLALPATFGLPDLIAAGALMNLDAYAQKYEPADFQRDALYPLGDYYRGSLYGYQTDGDAYLMFYKRDCLEDPLEQRRFEERHGYPLRVPRTWRELDTQMAYFHRPADGQYGGALFRTPNYIAWEFWVRFHGKGYWPFDRDLRPQINNEAGVAALEELVSASRNLYPDARTNGLFDNWKAFAKGNIYCNIGWGGTQKFLNSEKSELRGKLAFGPTPGGEIEGKVFDMPYFNWGWNYTVSVGSKAPELAYLFALYACSPAMSTAAVREASGFFDPFRKSHYNDPKIQATYSPAFLEAHRDSMARSIPDLYLTGQGEYFDALRQNLARADAGQLTAARALDLTAKQWEDTTYRQGRRAQAEQWALLRESYPAAIQAVLR